MKIDLFPLEAATVAGCTADFPTSPGRSRRRTATHWAESENRHETIATRLEGGLKHLRNTHTQTVLKYLRNSHTQTVLKHLRNTHPHPNRSETPRKQTHTPKQVWNSSEKHTPKQAWNTSETHTPKQAWNTSETHTPKQAWNTSENTHTQTVLKHLRNTHTHPKTGLKTRLRKHTHPNKAETPSGTHPPKQTADKHKHARSCRHLWGRNFHMCQATVGTYICQKALNTIQHRLAGQNSKTPVKTSIIYYLLYLEQTLLGGKDIWPRSLWAPLYTHLAPKSRPVLINHPRGSRVVI